VDLRWLTGGDVDVLVAASRLFDAAVPPEWAREFLRKPGHHLCLASVDAVPAGFVSGVETTHPDKGTEMFLYELGVDDAFRGRGIATALVEALATRARALGCHGMWVLTEEDNALARRTYLAAGGAEDAERYVQFEWSF
jgi:ribosomal protein S18 acetylase RimI-like enzyme